MLIFAVPLDAFLKADCDISTQDTVFGAASVFAVTIPFILLFFCYIFVYGISYTRLLISVTGNGLAATAALLMYNCTQSGGQILSNVITPGITSMLIGCDSSAGLTSSDMLYPICLLFTVFAAAVPVVCCTKKPRFRNNRLYIHGRYLLCLRIVCLKRSFRLCGRKP